MSRRKGNKKVDKKKCPLMSLIHISHLLPYYICLQLCLIVGDKVYSFLTSEESSSGETDAMIQALSTAIRQIFPTVPLK